MKGDFHTRSIGVAAALKYMGIDPATVGEDGGGARVFFYTRTPELTTALDSLFDGSFTAPIRDFLTVQHNFRLQHIAKRR